MMDKSKAPHLGKFINLDFIVQCMVELNRSTDDKYYLRVFETEYETTDLSKPYFLNIQVVCSSVIIHEKKQPISHQWDDEKLNKYVQNVCARFIIDCCGSGLINYKLAVDSLAESFAQETVLGQDRLSIIKKIIIHPPAKSKEFTRKPIKAAKEWDIMALLETTYENLIKCLSIVSPETKINTDNHGKQKPRKRKGSGLDKPGKHRK